MAFPDCKIVPIPSGEAGDACQQDKKTERRKRERSEEAEGEEGGNGKMEAGKSKLWERRKNVEGARDWRNQTGKESQYKLQGMRVAGKRFIFRRRYCLISIIFLVVLSTLHTWEITRFWLEKYNLFTLNLEARGDQKIL